MRNVPVYFRIGVPRWRTVSIKYRKRICNTAPEKLITLLIEADNLSIIFFLYHIEKSGGLTPLSKWYNQFANAARARVIKLVKR